MLDTFHPLRVAKDALQYEDSAYVYSWADC